MTLTDELEKLITERDRRTKYLGLTGLAGSGKDYVFELIQRRTKREVFRVPFADEVRREAASEVLRALGISPRLRDLVDWEKPYSEAQRRLLQWWGTDFRRAQDPDYWVQRGLETAMRLGDQAAGHSLIVFTDVRFRNEAEAISQIGGRVLEVWASDKVRKDRIGETPAHASEVIDFLTDGQVLNDERAWEEPLFDRHDAEWLELSRAHILELDGSITPTEWT